MFVQQLENFGTPAMSVDSLGPGQISLWSHFLSMKPFN